MAAPHGAHEVTLGRTPAERSPVLRAVYDVAFAYPDGIIDHASCAAGTATNDLLRLVFSYRGSIMYKMQAGMGDVVFAPMYEVLKARGVQFEFFHAVTGLKPPAATASTRSSTCNRRTSRAASRSTSRCDNVKGLPCWPNEPLWNQLEPAARGVDFEAELEPAERPTQTLKRGIDFDEVVLGIPVGALDTICARPDRQNERFARGINSAVTVRTQAFQLWANRRPRTWAGSSTRTRSPAATSSRSTPTAT